MKKAVYFMNEAVFPMIYGGSLHAQFSELVDIPAGAPLLTRENWSDHKELLKDVEVIISGWGGPVVDEAFLDAAPNFKLYLYGAGTIKRLMTDAAWERGVRITSAAAMNAIPVAEFTLAQIIFSLKHGWRKQREYRANPAVRGFHHEEIPGCYLRKVGVISLGLIGRRVCELLRSFDFEVMVFDPFAKSEDAEALGAKLVSLEHLFAECDVVSLHAPWLPETENMIHYDLLKTMKKGASFLNTARGALVNEGDLVRAMKERPDLSAMLDVTYPEPVGKDSPLLECPNIIITPHIAGALGQECQRMGQAMADELKHYLNGEPLKWEVTQQQLVRMA
jgi:phosphoglycerate dehydrogenase-like enzyme